MRQHRIRGGRNTWPFCVVEDVFTSCVKAAWGLVLLLQGRAAERNVPSHALARPLHLCSQCALAYKKMGIAPIVMSAGELESGNAGEPAKLMRQRYREVSTQAALCACHNGHCRRL